ncbi:transposase [Proteiniphilum propionicum]|nr:transposase [Proteiniphilum propionicum]
MQRCEGYPLHSGCLKANGNRTIEVNHRLLEYKRKAREKLTAEEGLEHRSNVP